MLSARIRREEVPLALAQADGLLAGKLGVTEAASALQIAARFPDDDADGWWPHRRADPGPHGRLTVKPDGSPLQRGPGHAHRGRSERGRLHPDSGGDYDPLYGSFVGDQGAWSTPRCTSLCLRNDLVLRRIRSLKRCVCGCKIMTPRYAVWQNAQQLRFCKASALKGPWLAFLVGFWLAWLGCGWLSGWLSGWFGLASGSGWFGLAPGWLSGWFGLAFFVFPVFLARLAETQLLGILQAYVGVSHTPHTAF